MAQHLSHRLRALRFYHWWLLGVLIVGLALRWAAILNPVDLLLSKVLPDDAFYYFTIARNISEGYGITFDRLAPTNGFHPLWLALITPVFSLLEGDKPIHAVLLLSSLMDAVSMLIAYRLVKRLTGQPEAGVLAGLLYFLNPFVWMYSINGLETSLNVMLIALTAERFVAIGYKTAPRMSDYLMLGSLLGLAVLARTDNVFLVASCGLVILLQRQIALSQRIKRLLAVGIAIAFFTAPWFMWNYLTFGSIIQVSGSILPYLERQIFVLDSPPPAAGTTPFEHTLFFLYEGLASTLIYAGFGRLNHIEGAFLIAALLLILGGTVIGTAAWVREKLWKWTRQTGFLILFIVPLYLFHQGIRWVYREWYALPITWTLMILVSFSCAAFVKAIEERIHDKKRWYVRIWVILGLLLLLRNYDFWLLGLYPSQITFIDLVHDINRLPDNARVGVSDSGFAGYRAQRQIVNLDGVVNNEAAQAIRDGELMSYLLDQGIGYIYSPPRYLASAFYGEEFLKYLKPKAFGGYKVMLDEDERRAYFSSPENGYIDIGTAWAWKYLGEGWNRAEGVGEGVWVDAPEAQLFVALPNQAQDHPGYRMQLKATPFSCGVDEPQIMDVTVNDVKIGSLILKADGPQEYELMIPSELLSPEVNVIRLHFAYHISPKSVGCNDDLRTLAAWLDYVQFVSK